MKPKSKVICIVGPTASGKTELSLALARAFDGEIISCDSMQIYRGMDIGTAKARPGERGGIPHHMIDIADPGQSYSCVQYAEDAAACARDIISRGKLPIFCGGTGQYLDAVLTGNVFSPAENDPALREELNAKDAGELWQTLYGVDPEAAGEIHKNNKKRVVRALETYYLTGVTKTEWNARSKRGEPPFDALVLGICPTDRETLYARIDERVDKMIDMGLEDEVRSLALDPGTTAGAAIGYKEFSAYFEGKCTREQAIENIKLASRHYAKRQMTWFRTHSQVTWLPYGDREQTERAAICLAKEFTEERKWTENT